jgi:hypothetical protein
MTGLRVLIERALDDLISNGEGMRFQGLAVILAKKRWKDLIASERQKDKGADAIAKVPFSAEGTGKVLACSITAKLEKVRADAEKVKTHFKDITKLIFATSSAVSNELGEKWVAEIQKDFGLDLAIMPREDIVTSLMDPENASLLDSHLGIKVQVEPTLAELVVRVREAASQLAADWAQRLAGKPLLALRALRLDIEGKDSAEVLSLGDIQAGLLHGQRIVLEGPAGRGKTTTLIQIAGSYANAAATPLLIDLTAWAPARNGILEFIAGMPHFQRRGLDAATLARVNAVEHFSFLLNGWNEIGELDFPHAESALRTIERDFPAAGIIVATRTHHVVPPLPGSMRVRLLTLTRRERAEYLRSGLGEKADELRLILDADTVLDQLTRTPFFLSEVTSLFKAGESIPSTKTGVLEAVTRLVERSDPHHNFLQRPPLSGRARDYLSELAIPPTAQGAISVADERARRAITAAGNRLVKSGQIATAPDPGSILAELCAHHILERQDYPVAAFRFEHQQFQEFYAAAGVEKRLYDLLDHTEKQVERDFAKSYVNEPAWAEPLRLVADHIRGQCNREDATRAIQAGTLLVKLALPLDPVFAAELARLCGGNIWKHVRSAVSERLRFLYASPDPHHRSCAFAAMLASGQEDFKDIIEPLLSGGGDQSILAVYRSWPDFHISSLGPDWRETVSCWNEDARVVFVSELLHNRNIPEVTALAAADSSVKVKEAAFQGLSWIGADEDAARIVRSFEASAFERMIEQTDPDLVPNSISGEAIRILHKRRAAETDPMARLSAALRLAAFGIATPIDDLKADLTSTGGKIDSNRAHYVIRPLLEIVGAADSAWVDAWIAERIADGSLWYEAREFRLRTVPAELKERLLHRLETEDFKHGFFGNIIAVLQAGADSNIAGRVFAKLCELRRIITNAPDAPNELERAVERQLDTLLRDFPADISVAGVSHCFAKPIDDIQLDVISRAFSNAARQEPWPSDGLSPSPRESLRAYLKGAIPHVLQLDDVSGQMNANVASVLSAVGSAQDFTDLVSLVHADIGRLRAVRAAQARGERRGRGVMGYAPWHIRAIVELDPVNSQPILLDLLKEPEYERDVSAELVRQVLPPPTPNGFFEKKNYEQIWSARAATRQGSQKERRDCYAAALRRRIKELLKERSEAIEKRPLEFRLRVLAAALAKIDSHGSADLVYQIMSIPDRWDNYHRVDAFEALLYGGVILPTDPTLALIDPCLEQWRKYGVQQQDQYLLTRFLCLLPFVNDPVKGIERMRQLISGLRLFPHQLQGVLGALGHSRSQSAWEFLLEIGSDKSRAEVIVQVVEAALNNDGTGSALRCD